MPQSQERPDALMIAAEKIGMLTGMLHNLYAAVHLSLHRPSHTAKAALQYQMQQVHRQLVSDYPDLPRVDQPPKEM